MQKSIDILETLLRQDKGKKFKRHTELLADFSDGYAKDWYFCVPKFFYEALDIKFTERKEKNKTLKLWTQGSTFKFSNGDTIWNHAYPYCENFVSEIIRLKIGVQVQSSVPCLPKTKDRSRNSGKVNFTIITESYDLNSKIIWKIAGNYTLSQDEFVELLIKGPSQFSNLNLNLG